MIPPGPTIGPHGAIPSRRGGRVVDRAALEMRSTGDRTGGSNPSLSATFPVCSVLRARVIGMRSFAYFQRR